MLSYIALMLSRGISQPISALPMQLDWQLITDAPRLIRSGMISVMKSSGMEVDVLARQPVLLIHLRLARPEAETPECRYRENAENMACSVPFVADRKHGRNIAELVDRLAQIRQVGIIAVAHHQRYALSGKGGNGKHDAPANSAVLTVTPAIR